jgi:hypothetical protein
MERFKMSISAKYGINAGQCEQANWGISRVGEKVAKAGAAVLVCSPHVVVTLGTGGYCLAVTQFTAPPLGGARLSSEKIAA